MSKTIQEQIQIMTHYLNGGDIEIFSNDNWVDAVNPGWNWNHCDYRIKEQKKTITIEKWLLTCDNKEFQIFELNNERLKLMLGSGIWKKVRLLETYEVEL